MGLRAESLVLFVGVFVTGDCFDGALLGFSVMMTGKGSFRVGEISLDTFRESGMSSLLTLKSLFRFLAPVTRS